MRQRARQQLTKNSRGHLVIAGTDLCIAVVLRWLGRGMSLEQIQAAHGAGLTTDTLRSALEEAAELADPHHAADMAATPDD